MNIAFFRNDYAQDVVASFCLHTLRNRPGSDVWHFCPFDLSKAVLSKDHPLYTPDVAYHQIKSDKEFLKLIAQKKFDLIVLVPYCNWSRSPFATWAHWIIDSPLNPLTKRLRRLRWRLRMIREPFFAHIPTIIIDMGDSTTLEPREAPLLTSGRLFFKREIPYDRYRLFPGTGIPSAQDMELVNKNLRQIPLGVDDDRYNFLRSLRQPVQDFDIFWAGGSTSSLRDEAAKRLPEIATRRGWNVCMPKGKISFAEFSSLMARSKITLSIAGRGWDCYRHSEAIAAGSAPLMNRPTVEAPAFEDLPAELFFENNFVDFEDKIAGLLAMTPERRSQIVSICDERVRAKTVWSSIMDYILAETRKRYPELPE